MREGELGLTVVVPEQLWCVNHMSRKRNKILINITGAMHLSAFNILDNKDGVIFKFQVNAKLTFRNMTPSETILCGFMSTEGV